MRNERNRRLGIATLAVAFALPVLAAASALAQEAPPATSLKGKFLVADPAMPDPRFQGTVIFLFEHSPSGGAIGVVINRPATRRPLAQVLAALGLPAPTAEAARAREIVLFWGGPVESDKAFLLHSEDFKSEGTAAVAPGIALSPPRHALTALGEGRGPASFVLAIGYAGWSPGQLEAELARKGWAVVTADADLLFGTDHLGKWERAWRMRTQDL
jgi:putative transcriptional regulator